MRQRSITAFFFAAVMLGGIFGGKIFFFALFAIVSAGCAWELGSLIFKAEDRFVTLRKIICAALPTLIFIIAGGDILKILPPSPLAFLSVIPLLFALLSTLELFLAGKNPFLNIGTYLLSSFYIGLPLVLLATIPFDSWDAQNEYHPLRVLALLLLVWTNDTGAYLFGSKFGKHKLLERISPKKTWEGSIGGAIFAVLGAWGLSFLIKDFTLQQWLALSVVAAIGSNIGDLVESMLKRSVGVKDSGKFLPGHGGLLDRFDAFIFCLPFFWLVLQVV
ncbi:MAG: phosphatidate cytidylyltransferase [Saprospiraceae bacterium]